MMLLTPHVLLGVMEAIKYVLHPSRILTQDKMLANKHSCFKALVGLVKRATDTFHVAVNVCKKT